MIEDIEVYLTGLLLWVEQSVNSLEKGGCWLEWRWVVVRAGDQFSPYLKVNI